MGTTPIGDRYVLFYEPLESHLANYRKQPLCIHAFFVSVSFRLPKQNKTKKTIRSTWGKPNGFEAKDTSQRTDGPTVSVFFLVQCPWDEIAEEFGVHQDLVWIDPTVLHSDFVARANATIQVASFLKLLDHYAAGKYTHLFRLPDTSYANFPGIRLQLSSHQNDTKVALWGTNCRTGLRPGHLGIPDSEYSDYFFPQYCRGKAYGMSEEFVHCAASHIGETRIISLDDVYIGILGERCQLESTQFLWSSDRERGDENLMRVDYTVEKGIARRYSQQKIFW